MWINGICLANAIVLKKSSWPLARIQVSAWTFSDFFLMRRTTWLPMMQFTSWKPPSINPFIFNSHFLLHWGSWGSTEASLSCYWGKAGWHTGQVASSWQGHRDQQPFTFTTTVNLDFPIPLTGMCVNCGRSQANPTQTQGEHSTPHGKTPGLESHKLTRWPPVCQQK